MLNNLMELLTYLHESSFYMKTSLCDVMASGGVHRVARSQNVGGSQPLAGKTVNIRNIFIIKTTDL